MAQSEDSKNPPQQNDEAVTVNEVTMDGGTVDFRDRSGIVSGNVYRGGVIRGDKQLTVEGQVVGVPESRCSIEMGGNIQIENAAVGARISGRNVVIMGNADACQIQADNDIEIHGNFTNGQVVLGSRSGDIRRVNQLRIEERLADLRVNELKVQTSLAARKFIRDYPQVDLRMGNILVPQRRDLRVDLRQFYNAVETADVDKVDRALEEFYMRVVVGMLTRNNKNYISRNPSRHKIFLKMIEELRKHMLKIRELDKYQERVRILRRDNHELLESLKNPDQPPQFRVGGTVGGGVIVRFFRLKGFQETPSNTVEIDRETTEARVVSLENNEGLTLEITSPDGEKSVQKIEGNTLSNGKFVPSGDSIVWRPVT